MKGDTTLEIGGIASIMIVALICFTVVMVAFYNQPQTQQQDCQPVMFAVKHFINETESINIWLDGECMWIDGFKIRCYEHTKKEGYNE